MSELRKANTDYPYFVTLTVVGWIDVFTRSKYSDIVLDSLGYCRKHKGLELFEYVVMPSHVHLIIRNLEGELAGIIRDMKAHTAKQIIKAIEGEAGESRREWLLHMFRYHAKYPNCSKLALFLNCSKFVSCFKFSDSVTWNLLV
jgi:putative transposase